MSSVSGAKSVPLTFTIVTKTHFSLAKSDCVFALTDAIEFL